MTRDAPQPDRHELFNPRARLDTSRVRDVNDNPYASPQQSYLDQLVRRNASQKTDIELGALAGMPIFFAGNPTPNPGATLNYSDIASQYGMGGAAASTSASASSKDDPQILWDFTSEHLALDKRGPRNIAVKKSKSSLLTAFDQMSLDEQRQMAGFLTIAGYLSTSDDTSFEDFDNRALLTPLGKVRDAYAQLLDDAATRQAAPYNQPVTPMGMLKERIAYRMASAGIRWNGNLDKLGKLTGMTILAGSGYPDEQKAKGPKPGDTRTLKQTSTARDIMDPTDAKGLTRAMLQQELGRDPTEAEFEDFVAMLQHAQRADPTTQTQTAHQTYMDGEGWYTDSSHTTTHQGISSQGLQELALEKAQQNPDWAEWQAVGTYAPALFEALGATVPGVGS